MQLTPVEQFPLDFFAGLQTDGGCQSQREAHVESGFLSARADRLEPIDSLLRQSGAERDFARRALAGWRRADAAEPTAREQEKFQRRSRRALRCALLRTLLREDYRGFSCQLAGNPLYQWFCLVDAPDQVRVPSKSELQRFAHWLPAGQMRAVIGGLLRAGVGQPRQMELREAVNLEAYFLDSTCVRANIHFPTGWVLLRDGARTLMKATLLIRQAGLRGRMEAPEEFLRRMSGSSALVRRPTPARCSACMIWTCG
jgi:hypothetical protein